VFFLLNEDCRRLVLVRLEEEEAAPRLKRLLWVATALSYVVDVANRRKPTFVVHVRLFRGNF
jgi:hypothetical protein